MPSRRLASAAAVVLLASLTAVPAASAHDDGGKENAGGEGPTDPNLGFGSFPNSGLVLKSRLNLTQLAAPGADVNTNLSSAWGWTDSTTGNEYALMARTSDLAIVDITTPTAPVLIGNVQRTAGTAATNWRDVRVVGDWAYIGVDSANAGIQAFNLARVRGVTSPQLFDADAVFTGVSNTHSLATNFNSSTPYLYTAGGNTRSNVPSAPQTAGGLQILNVSNPMAITTAGSWQTDGYIHETTVFTYSGPDAAHVGKHLAFNATGNGGDPNSISIVDVTDPTLPVRLSQDSYASTGYTHQGWLTEDHKHLIVNDELDELNHLTGAFTRTHLYDVSDLDSPVYRGFFEWGNGAIDHNLYIVGDYIFQANYTRGIRVFEIGDLDSLDTTDWMTEVAWLDTYPANDGVSFNGAWQVYPYFDSGNIIVSDINGGLFVVAVPEPAGVAVLSLGALTLLRRRRRRC